MPDDLLDRMTALLEQHTLVCSRLRVARETDDEEAAEDAEDNLAHVLGAMKDELPALVARCRAAEKNLDSAVMLSKGVKTIPYNELDDRWQGLVLEWQRRLDRIQCLESRLARVTEAGRTESIAANKCRCDTPPAPPGLDWRGAYLRAFGEPAPESSRDERARIVRAVRAEQAVRVNHPRL